MACEFVANAVQSVALNSPVVFGNASIPCKKGYVYFEDETGVLILKGITNNQCFATYRVTYNGNVAIPEGGAVTAVGIALVVNGEPRLTSRAIFQPQAVNEYGNLTSTAIIKVPKGCCFSLSIEYVQATDDPATTPTPIINVQNSNLVVDRIA